MFLWSLPIQLIIILSISHLSFKFIEQPFRKIINIKRIKIISTGILSILISFLGIIFINVSLKDKLFTGKFPQEDFKVFMKHLPKEFSRLDLKSKIPNSKVIYFFGDSHIFNTLPSLYKVKKSLGFDQILIRNIENMKDVSVNDLLIFTSRSYENQPEIKEQIVKKLSTYVKNTKSKLILLDDLTPFGKSPVIDYYSKFSFFRKGPFIKKKEAENFRKNHTLMLKKYIDNKNIFYLDPLPVICSEDVCSAVKNDKLIFADSSPHINKNGINVFKDFWQKNLLRILNN